MEYQHTISGDHQTPAVILVVDDDQAIRLTLRYILQQDHYSVIEAGNGEEALALYTKYKPELVLLDAMMPVIDGFETCRRLRQMPEGEYTPILMITALDDDQSVDEAFAVGATDFVTKPIHWAVLRHRIRQIIQASRDKANLAATEAHMQTVVFHALDGMVTFDRHYRLKSFNPAAENIFGYTAQEILDQPLHLLIAEPELNNLQSATSIRREVTGLRKDGTRFPLELAINQFGTNGQSRFVAVLRDVSQRWQAEAQIRYQANLIQHVSDAIISTDSNFIIKSWNHAAEIIYGWSAGEVIGKPIGEVLATTYVNYNNLQVNTLSHTFETGLWTGEAVQKRKDGVALNVQSAVSVLKDELGRPIGTVAVNRNVTEWKQAEENIRRSNRELMLLNKVIAVSTTTSEPDSILDVACRELAQAFTLQHVTATLLNQKKTEALVMAEYSTQDGPAMVGQSIKIKGNYSYQYLLIHKTPLALKAINNDGPVNPAVDLMCRPETIALLLIPLIIDGEVIGSLGLESCQVHQFSVDDINLAWSVADQVAGVLARARLLQTQRLLSTTIEQAGESIVITDAQGVITYVNPAFEHVTGYKAAEAIGQTPRLLKSGQHNSAVYQELWSVITSGQVWRGRLVNRKKDGTLYTEDTIITPIYNENRVITNFIAGKHDITTRLQLEEQFRQAQKMEAIGRLTSGVAHDFNNLLTAINGFAELMLYRKTLASADQEMLANILRSGQHAATLIRQLMAFSRKEVIVPQLLNLNSIVTEMSKMLQRIIGDDIQLKVQLTSDLWLTKIDPAQVDQIIMNLAVNARDAMPHGGHLTLETANVTIDQEYASLHLETQPGDYALLAVSDTGIGMSQAVQARIFEPFFTTKETGKGTGLGLSTVYGIVKQNGGKIWVYSEEGKGTTFKIYLPRVADTAPVRPEAGGHSQALKGSGTILLVEDNLGVRQVLVKILRFAGYTVLEAASGSEALSLAQGHPSKIELLLTDVVMPQMNGQELANRIKSLHPEIKILFTSGYTDNSIVSHRLLEPGAAYIQKPVSLVALTRKVHQVLHGDKEQ